MQGIQVYQYNLLQRNIQTIKSKPHRRHKLSDFHEMANNLQMREERTLHIKNPAYTIDKGGRRLGIERREFTYSQYYPERRVGMERRCVPERRVELEAGANG